MAFNQTTLANELKAGFDALVADANATEADAIEKWAEAFTKYFEGAAANGAVAVVIAALRTPTTGPKDAMKAAMTGMSTAGLADDKIQAGIQAFWSPINATPVTYFLGTNTPSTPPAGLAALAATLATTFTTTKNNANATRQTAADAIAAAIHAANAGGIATQAVSPFAPWTIA